MRPAPDNLTGSVDLYWIPLGAGASVVRGNGIMYEAISAAIEHRPRCHLYHSALGIVLPHGRYTVEMTPVPDGDSAARGVVAEGPVGLRVAGRLRMFRYEVRRWRDGVVPDLAYAVGSALRVTDDGCVAQRVFDVLPGVPRLVWGRDESGAGEMWSCNSITSWALARAGVDISGIALPLGGRAPGWDAGAAIAGHGQRISGADEDPEPDPQPPQPVRRRVQHACHDPGTRQPSARVTGPESDGHVRVVASPGRPAIRAGRVGRSVRDLRL